MHKKIAIVVAPTKYREEELFNTISALEKEGAEIEIVSKKNGTCYGQIKNTATEANLRLEDIKPEEYKGIVFIGGFGASVYFDDEKAKSLAKEFYDAQKIVAAICIAPSILANAGILKGKTVTCYDSEIENMKKHGANYTGKPTEKDGLIITGKDPASSTEFGELIARTL